MTPETKSERDRLLKALQDVWRIDEGVRRFNLAFEPDRIEQRYGGWIVPVASGVPTGSAYDLARALDHLREVMEQQTSLSVSVFLKPLANGTGH